MYIAMLLTALSMTPEIDLVGRLMIADIVCVVIVGIAIITRRFPPLLPAEKIFYGLVFLWLLSLVISDIYQGAPFVQFSRGWSNIGFFIINFSAIRILTNRDLKKSIYLMMFVLLGAAVKFYFGTGNIDKTGVFSLDWKFAYGIFFTASVLFLVAQLNSRNVKSQGSYILAIGAAAFNLALNARSLFGQSALAVIVGLMTSGRRRIHIRPSMLLWMGFLAVGGGVAIVQIYSYSAENGLLGKDAQAKYERQAENSLGLLLGGRTELLGSVDAIMDSPLIGYGSYARNREYALLRLIRLQQAGIVPTSMDLKSDRIPTHSFLLGAWVEAGLLGAVFWLWVLYTTGKGVIASIERPTQYTAFIGFVGVSLAWDVFFSPFGLDRRMVTPAMLNLMLLAGSSLYAEKLTIKMKPEMATLSSSHDRSTPHSI